MKEWKFVGLCLLLGCLIFFSLNQFAKALQPDAISLDDNLGNWKIEAMSATFVVIDAVSPDSAWGLHKEFPSPSRLYHYDGDKWRLSHTFSVNEDVSTLSMVSETDGWAAGVSSPWIGSNLGGVVWRYDGIQWQRFSMPIEQNIIKFDIKSATDGWAVTNDFILKFDGIQWQDTGIGVPPGGNHIDTFIVFSDSQIWLKRYLQPVYIYNGSEWQEMAEWPDIHSFTMVSANDGWGHARYQQGVFQYDGNQWLEMPAFSNFAIGGIDMLAPDYGWAVGYDYWKSENILLHYDGTEWQKTEYPDQGSQLRKIFMADEEKGWIIDEDGRMLEYVDGAWQYPEDGFEPTNVTDVIWQIQVSENGAAWFGGLEKYFDGFHWQPIPLHSETQNFVQISRPSQVVTPTKISLVNFSSSFSGEGWALGSVDYQSEQSGRSTLDDVLFKFDSGMWKPLTTTVGLSLDQLPPKSKFQMFSEEGGWLFRGYNRSAGSFFRYKSGAWESIQGPTIRAFDSYAISATDIWAVGGSLRMFSSTDVSVLFSAVSHFDGTAWQTIENTPGKSLNAIDMVSDTEGWAVGDVGTILHYVNGSWILEPSPVTSDLWDIDMVSATEGWAISIQDDNDQSAILYYDGNSWQVAGSITGSNLYAISVLNRYTGYIVGYKGLVLKLFDQASITPDSGGELVVSGQQDRKATIQVPTNSIDIPTTLVYKSFIQHPSPEAMLSLEPSFTLQAYRGDDALETLDFAKPVTLTLDYGTHLASPKEQSIVLMSWDGQQWIEASSTCAAPVAPIHDMAANRMSVSVCRTGEFGLFMERGPRLYLPFVSDK